VLVPRGTCVASDLHAGIGGLEIFGHTVGGIDADRVDTGQAPAGAARVVVTGDVGLGLISIDHESDEGRWDDRGGRWNHDDRRNDDGRDSGNACIGDRDAQG
jgi:hypothetical protein